MSYEQDERGVPINQKSHEDLMREIERVKNERAQKVHEERTQRKEEPQIKQTESIPNKEDYSSKLKSDIGHELEKAKTFGHAVVGLGDRKPVGTKIYSELKKEYSKYEAKQKAQAEKQAARDEKLDESYFAGKLKRAYSGEEQRHRRIEEVYELRTKTSGKAVAGGFNLRSVRPSRQEYRQVPQASQDVFGMSGIFGNVSAPQTNIGRTPRRGVRTEVRNQGRADTVLGLTSFSVVGNVPQTSIRAPRRFNEPQRKVVVREDVVSILGLGNFSGTGRNPVRQNVGKQVSTKLSKESKIKTKVPQQSEDPLGLNKYSF